VEIKESAQKSSPEQKWPARDFPYWTAELRQWHDNKLFKRTIEQH
jgi:hypothetical protein